MTTSEIRTPAPFAVLLLGAIAGCAVNPATGERQLSLISEGEEIRMGREADREIVRSMGLYGDEELRDYVSELGQRLAARSERPDLPWTFRVLDDPTVNAFALPGGFVYVTRGILSHFTSEAQLAGVLGHEIGHITALHSVNQMSKAQLAQLGVGVGMVFVPELQEFGDLTGVGLQLLFLKYGRDDENQADQLGIRYMTRLEYDPRQLGDVMAMLERTSELREGSGRVPQWLSTHPHPENRVENIEERVRELSVDLSTYTVAREPFLRRLDGVVFGPDPREGYFEGDLFLHPELRFRLRLPTGWRHVNTKQAVQSVSPDQDAAVLLTLEEGVPEDAMRAFGAQTGVRIGAVSGREVNGLQATRASFSARTEQGTLVGVVVFVRHGRSTYRLLGYGPQGAWSGRQEVVEASLSSFAPEDDPAVLGVMPDRISLVHLDDSQTFRVFAERYSSTTGTELLALINQVDLDQRIDAGTLLKRVVDGR